MFDTHIPNVPVAVEAFKSGKCGSHAETLKTYLPEILEADVHNDFSNTGPLPFRAAVFNMERGTYIKAISAYFKHHPMLREADVVFANELDWGMARTGNANIAADFAKTLSFNYVYGVEFVSARAGKDGNERGLHGNAIFSRFPLENAKVIQLPIKYEWFYKQGDCRLGMRNAVLAVANTSAGYIGLVSVHLENRATPSGRKAQMEFLLNEAEAHFGKTMPVLIGGDMNSNTVDGDKDGEMQYLADHPAEMWHRIGQVPAYEPLLDYAASRGFSYADCNVPEKTTRRKPMDDGRTVALNLDWFFQRGLTCSAPVKIESIFHKNGLIGALADSAAEIAAFQGQELSDHDMVMVRCGIA
ncbi:endonuclease [Spirochaetia bacterium]|nr:endonuclease [Spirochaetia bacterium]